MAIELTAAFQRAFPDGVFGALVVRNCPNRPRALAIQEDQHEVEMRMKTRFPGQTFDADPVARAYAGYFRRYGERYPVVHQAKGILAGKSIQSPSALVEVMFTAELESLVLTSGHDMEALAGSLRVDVAQEGDAYIKLSGKEQRLRPGDMVVRDAEGIIACVLFGPDYRTRFRPESHTALFGAWCPIGVPEDTVRTHLATLAQLVRQEWAEATIADPILLTTNA